MLEQEKDWMVVPPELMQIIAKKLSDILDFIRLRATCKTWRNFVPLSDAPPQLPWFLELLEGTYNNTNGSLSKRQRFYSVSSGQTHTICLYQYKRLSNWIKGVFSHFLPFADFCDNTLLFFNPLTNDRFSLPWPRLGPYAPWMVWTGTDSFCDRSIFIVGRGISRLNDLGGWAIYHPHNNKWVEQEGKFYNCCYWQGMLFSTDVACVTNVFDASSKKLLHKILPPENELRNNDWFDKGHDACMVKRVYLIESLGIILRVSCFYDFINKKIVEDSIFHIYRLEFDGLDGQPCWVRIVNIGNQILFLEEMTAFSMTARPSIGFREGCIYFINFDDNKPYVHDILAGTVERVPCPFERCAWFLPGVC